MLRLLIQGLPLEYCSNICLNVRPDSRQGSRQDLGILLLIKSQRVDADHQE